MLNTVEVELDKIRHLRFDIAALVRLQQRTAEKSTMVVLQRIDQMDIETILTAYWIGLGTEDGTLTLEKVRKLIQAKVESGANLMEMGRLVARSIAMGAGFVETAPGGETAGDDPGKAPTPETGT